MSRIYWKAQLLGDFFQFAAYPMTGEVMVTTSLPPVTEFPDNDTNLVLEEQITERPLSVEIALTVSLAAIITICLLGNVTVLFAFSRCSELREQISSVFIVNLALTDIGCATTVMPFVLVSIWYNHWVFGSIMCGLICFLNYLFIIVSMWTLAMISIDRHLYCIYPFRYQEFMTHRRAVILCLLAWGLGFFFGSAPSVMGVVIYNHAEIICAVDWEADPVKVLTYTVSAFVICFITPMVVMIYCYQGLYRVARRHAMQLQQRNTADTMNNSMTDNESPNTANLENRTTTGGKSVVSQKRNMKAQERRTTRNSKAIRSICIMVLAYFICNTPFSVTKLLKCVFSNNDVVPFYFNAVASWIAFSNPCCNPIIYSIYREDFKNALRRFMPTLIGKKVNTQISPAAVQNKPKKRRDVNKLEKPGLSDCDPTSTSSGPVNGELQGACAASVSEKSSNHPMIIISPPRLGESDESRQITQAAGMPSVQVDSVIIAQQQTKA